MPVISRFRGIILRMYLRQKEHNPPHIHAQYGDSVGLFFLENGEMFEGDLDKKMRSFLRILLFTIKNSYWRCGRRRSLLCWIRLNKER